MASTPNNHLDAGPENDAFVFTVRPTEAQLAPLSRSERFIFSICDEVNRRRSLKEIAYTFQRVFGAWWVHHCTKNRVRVYGLENVTALQPDRGVVFVGNHRSFFDLYVIIARVMRTTPWFDQIYFPVRSNYFYNRIDGLAINALMSGLSMFPPVMRDGEKRGMNQYMIDVLTEVLRSPGALVGIHPEGARNKTDDPYTLLPARPGVGEILYHARPIVIPVFTLGLGNKIVSEIASNFSSKYEPITLVFGEPVDLSKRYSLPATRLTYHGIANDLRDVMMALGERERAIRVREGFPDLSATSSEPARGTRRIKAA